MKKKGLVIIISIITVFAIYHILLSYDLKHNGVIVQGVITSSGYSAKTSQMWFRFKYFYKTKERENDSRAGVRYPRAFYGKSFPVIVSTLTKRSVILIAPEHFKKFNIPYPDSLKWVLQYIE